MFLEVRSDTSGRFCLQGKILKKYTENNPRTFEDRMDLILKMCKDAVQDAVSINCRILGVGKPELPLLHD